MLLTSRSTGFLLTLFLFGLGFQLGIAQTYNRSFCTGITMPETHLCDDNLPIIKIVEVSQYDGVNSNLPCVYRASDCGRAIRHNTQLYKDVITLCDGQRTCGGFYITSVAVCSRRSGDYIVISFRCRRDETATTAEPSATIRASSLTNQQTTASSTTTPTSATPIGSPVNPSNIIPTVSTSTGSPVNPQTSSGVTGVDYNVTERGGITHGLYAGVAGGGVVAVILVIVVIVVCVKRKKRHTESKPSDTNDGDTPAAHQTNGEQQSSRIQTPGENDIVLEEIVTDNNANETSPEQPTPDRMTADDPAVSQHDPDLAKKDSPACNNPGHDDTMHLATPTADTPEAWGYSSVGAAISEPSPSSKEPKYDQHNTHTIPATIQKSVDTNHTTGPDVYATVQKDKPHTSDIQNKAPDDTKEPDVYATVQKDRGEDADELVMEDNPLYT